MSLFITATDTGVGKTLITGGLAYALRQRGYDVGCWKPVQSGDLLHDRAGDAARLKEVGGLRDPLEQICGYSYAEPLAPRLAAERAGTPLQLADLLTHRASVQDHHQHWLSEGAGGLAVPLTSDALVVDLALALGHPLLIVARAALGTVNHTVLTVEYARARGLQVAGVILSGGGREGGDLSEAHNRAYIEAYAQVPVLGSVPWLGAQPSAETIREAVALHVDIERVGDLIGSGIEA